MRDKAPPSTVSLGFGISPSVKVSKSRSVDGGRQARILVVESDPELRRVTTTRLDGANYQTESVETAQEALDACVRSRPNLVIADLRQAKMDGVALLKELKSRWPELTVIMLVTHIAIPRAVQAIQFGAFSYLVKPVDKSELLDHVKRAIAVSTFKADCNWQADIAARSRLMDDRLAQINRAARSDAPVLLTGENGTGKELLARAIHAASARRDKPFVSVSCRTAVESWLEQELFGHATDDTGTARDAGTAADAGDAGGAVDAGGARDAGGAVDAAVRRSGAIRAARGGTLLINEIGNLPARLQLRFIQALGEVRLICMTSCDLQTLVDVGKLRKDLFEQINALPMEIPPLGRRREDIPLLVSHFLEQATDPNDDKQIFSSKAIELLVTADWPESVRQLYDLVKQNVALQRTQDMADGSDSTVPTFDEARDKFSREYLVDNLRMTDGNVSKSARLAKRNRTDFYKLLARYRVRPGDFKHAPTQGPHAEM